MERFQSNDSRDNYIGIVKLVDQVVQLPVADTYQLAKAKLEDESSPYLSLGTAVSAIAHEAYRNNHWDYIEHGEAFLSTAINDVMNITDIVAKKYPTPSDEELLAIMSHPETINSVALLAMRPEWNMLPYIPDKLKHTGRLTEAGSFVIDDDSLDFSDYLNESRGCPAAGRLDRTAQSGEVNPVPAFEKIVPWAAEFYIVAHES